MTRFQDMEVACPHCGVPHLEAVMMSTNNAGWTIWSDGFEGGVFSQRRSGLRLCAVGHPFMVGTAEMREVDRAKRPEPPRTAKPTRSQLHAIADGVDDAEMVLDARLFAWWDANAEERDMGAQTALNPEDQANARGLLSLFLKQDQPFTLAKAQIARQFGWFTEAERTYAEATDLPEEVRATLVQLSRRRDGRIVRLAGG